jgi:hypothetical protein
VPLYLASIQISHVYRIFHCRRLMDSALNGLSSPQGTAQNDICTSHILFHHQCNRWGQQEKEKFLYLKFPQSWTISVGPPEWPDTDPTMPIGASTQTGLPPPRITVGHLPVSLKLKLLVQAAVPAPCKPQELGGMMGSSKRFLPRLACSAHGPRERHDDQARPRLTQVFVLV